VTGGDLNVPEVDADIEHGRDERMPEHMRVGSVDPDPRRGGEVVQAAGGCVPVHPGAAAVEQDRPAHPGSDCPVNSPPDGRRQRDQDDLSALTWLHLTHRHDRHPGSGMSTVHPEGGAA
jgi:hypothetical protein